MGFLTMIVYLLVSMATALLGHENVCKTTSCAEASKSITSNMDATVNPCDDFYLFACGNFLKNTIIPKKEMRTSATTEAATTLMNETLPLFEDPGKQPNDLRAFKMARYFYEVCLDESAIESRGITMFLDRLKSAGGWPVLEGGHWKKDNYNWITTTHKLQKKYLRGEFISVGMTTDPVDSFTRMMEIHQISLSLNRVYLVKGRGNKQVDAYGKYMIDIAVLFGAKPESASKEMSEVLDFEIKLANITLSPEELRDPTKKKAMQIKQLQASFPIVKWKQYLKSSTLKIIKFHSSDQVKVSAPGYLQKLEKLLGDTEDRTIANYQFWQAVFDKIALLPKAFRDRQLLYMQQSKGVREIPPRSELCLKGAIKSFDLAAGAMYLRHHFNKYKKGNITDMVERIRGEMLNSLAKLTWMDEATRKKAIEKAKAMNKLIAYPEELFDDKKIEKYYEKLDIMGEEYFESCINLIEFSKTKQLHRFHEKVNKSDWTDHGDVLTINAFYDPQENSIELPLGMLQDSIISSDSPKYIIYARIGKIIGHEITHGFDDRGQKYDKLGNLFDWWQPSTNNEFKKRMKCVMNQAVNYNVKEVNMTLNGFMTQGEDVADIGGLKLAVAAYDNWAKTVQKPEPRLAGLEHYSPRQLFWISSASFSCTKYVELYLRNLILTNSHSPAEYRIFNSFSNQETFARDFNCSLGTRMNPKDKCNVW